MALADSPHRALAHWVRGIRFYIACAIVLVSIEAWWWAYVNYAGSILFATRLEEFYAWLSLGLLIAAITIGPVYSVWPKLPAKIIMRDARRLLGIGAAWFATLHVAITYDALFKLANPFSLPQSYQQAFLFGSIGLIILLAMAFTSFDKAFNRLGKWWFRLHRLVYVAVFVSLFHAFLIGTHATGLIPLMILTILAAVLISLHFYLTFVRPDRPTIWQLLAVSAAMLITVAIFNFGNGQRLGYNPLEGKYHHAP